MTYREAIERCVKERKMTKTAVAAKLGMTPQDFRNKLFRYKTATADNVIAVMDALGYDVVIRDRISGEEVVLGK